jgi:Leucine-rich repeat (LRR) protein
MSSRTRSIRTRARSTSIANTVASGNSTLAWHRKPLNANATILTECSFGVSHDRLLQILTDAAPYEPDWKDLKRIDLHGRDVESAVRMKEFLPRLDEANLWVGFLEMIRICAEQYMSRSNNCLSYLTGFPHTLRFLHLSHNKLSDLTSFSHIGNLETLNVSHNPRITSLVQLASLKHLRSLQAQACQIDTLDGIADLDGLLDLDLSDNQLQSLQLEHTAWKRLESLSAHNNRICSVSGIERLSSLRAINLGEV